MSYWVYQHLGNLSPRALDEDDLYRRVRGNVHATNESCASSPPRSHTTGNGSRWSFCRDLGRTRVIFIDSRAGRVLERGRALDRRRGRVGLDRSNTPRATSTTCCFATTVPFLLSPGFHHLEAWSERVGDGAWGGLAARLAEKMRRARRLRPLGLLRQVLPALRKLLEEVGSGERGRPPASIVVLSGDVHHAYLAETGLRSGTAAMRERRLPGGLLALPQPARAATSGG